LTDLRTALPAPIKRGDSSSERRTRNSSRVPLPQCPLEVLDRFRQRIIDRLCVDDLGVLDDYIGSTGGGGGSSAAILTYLRG
jgi:hypothetical protein